MYSLVKFHYDCPIILTAVIFFLNVQLLTKVKFKNKIIQDLFKDHKLKQSYFSENNLHPRAWCRFKEKIKERDGNFILEQTRQVPLCTNNQDSC